MRTELMPGVFLTAVYTEKFKSGVCSVNLLRPLTERDAACAGFAMRVLMQGTERYPDMGSLSLAQESIYGAVVGDILRKKGEVLSVGLLADFIDDSFVGDSVFSKVASLMGEILLHPATDNGVFRADYVAREQESVLNEIRARINSKRTYAVSQTVREMCKDEPYGIDKFGSEETVGSQTAQSLYAYYREMLETSQVEICYIGRQQPQTVAEILKSCLAELPRGEITKVSTSANPPVTQVREITERLEVTQGKLCMGFRITDQVNALPWAAVTLFNTVFGSGVSSKLFLNVREKLSLCYYAASSIEKIKRVMLVDSGVDFSNFEAARSEILRQLEDCRRGEISDEELALARSFLISRWRAAQDSLAQLDEFSLGQVLLGSSETMDDMICAIASVSKDEVVAAANCVALDTVYYLKGTEG